MGVAKFDVHVDLLGQLFMLPEEATIISVKEKDGGWLVPPSVAAELWKSFEELGY